MANKRNVCLVTDWPNFITAHFTVYDTAQIGYHCTLEVGMISTLTTERQAGNVNTNF